MSSLCGDKLIICVQFQFYMSMKWDYHLVFETGSLTKPAWVASKLLSLSHIAGMCSLSAFSMCAGDLNSGSYFDRKFFYQVNHLLIPKYMPLKFFLFIMYNCVCVCWGNCVVCMCMWVQSYWIPLELELQAAVCCSVWVLGMNFRLLKWKYVVFTTEPSFQTHE